MKKTLIVLSILLGLICIYFQTLNFIFVNMNRSVNEAKDYTFDNFAQISTIIILIWFIIKQVKKVSL
jgi:sortase (surface protein transpeptidase)